MILNNDHLPEETIIERLAKCKNGEEIQTLFDRTCSNSEFSHYAFPIEKLIEIERSDSPYFKYEEVKDKREKKIEDMKEYFYRKANNLLTTWYFKAWGEHKIFGFIQLKGSKIAIYTMSGRIESDIEKMLRKILVK